MDLRRIYTPPPPRQLNASSGDRAESRGARLRAGPPPRERVHGFIPAPQRLTAPLSLHGGGVLTSDTMRAARYGVGAVLAGSEADCRDRGGEWYQPPMPPCPPGALCVQAFPPMRCRFPGDPPDFADPAPLSPFPVLATREDCEQNRGTWLVPRGTMQGVFSQPYCRLPGAPALTSTAMQALQDAQDAAARAPVPEGPSAGSLAALAILGLVAYAWSGA